MKLNMQLLADELAEIITDKSEYTRKEQTLTFVRHIKPVGAREILPSVVYIGSDADFLQARTRLGVSAAIYCGDTSISDMPFDDEAEVIRVRADIQGVELLSLVNEAFFKYHSWATSLQQAVLDGAGIDALAQLASDCFANPLAIVDNSGYCLAWSGSIPENYRNPLWDAILGRGYAYDSDFATKYDERWSEAYTRKDAYINVLPNESPPYQTLIKNIFVGQERKGNIGMTDARSHFSDGQCRLIEYFADEILSRHFARNPENNIENDRRDCFLANSISESPLQNKELAEMLGNYGIDDSRSLRLLVLADRKQEKMSLLQVEYFLARLREQRRIGEMLTSDPRRIVILSPWLADLDELNTRAEEYKKLLDGANIAIGASVAFRGHRYICHHFEQACIALDYGLKLHPKGRLHNYLDFSVAHMIDEYRSRHNAQVFCHPMVKLLHEYDVKNKTEYLNTLEELCKHAGNQVNAAEALHIHRNSLVYRTKKILDILGVDELPKDATLHVMLSCQMMRDLRV